MLLLMFVKGFIYPRDMCTVEQEYPVPLQRGAVRGSITVWCLQGLGIALGLLLPVHMRAPCCVLEPLGSVWDL